MSKEKSKLLTLLQALEVPLDCADKQLWDKWVKEELVAALNRMPQFKTMRYQALQSIAKEKIVEIQALKANKTTKQ